MVFKNKKEQKFPICVCQSDLAILCFVLSFPRLVLIMCSCSSLRFMRDPACDLKLTLGSEALYLLFL